MYPNRSCSDFIAASVSASVAPWPQISRCTYSSRPRHKSSSRGKLFGLPTSIAFEYGGLRRPRTKFSRPQIFRHDIVRVRGRDKSRHRQSDALGKNSRGQIPEISARHRNDQRHRRHRQLPVRRHVIKHLRQQPPDIDRIRRRQKCALVQLGIRKRLLHQPLAIVKRAGHFQRRDVFAQRRELFFLRFADALRRIQNHHANSRHAQKSVRHRASRVSRSRDQHRERPRLAAHEITHQPRHESRAEILERQRRPVKQLQNVQPRRQRNHLHRKIDRLADHLPQHFFRHFRRRERFHDAEADFGKRQRAKLFQLLRRTPRNFHRHIQSAVRREPAQHRSAQRRQRRFPRCASISHAYIFCEFNV